MGCELEAFGLELRNFREGHPPMNGLDFMLLLWTVVSGLGGIATVLLGRAIARDDQLIAAMGDQPQPGPISISRPNSGDELGLACECW